MSETGNKTLVKKLAEVMKEVKKIPKTGFNKYHKYHYATESDVSERVREELAKRHIIMIPDVKEHKFREHSTKNGGLEYIVTVQINFTFIDGESDERISFSTYGEGQDAGDKGTYKAITGAHKYALMKTFMIPTGDDPEADESVDERNVETSRQKLSEGQVKRLFAIGNSSGYTAAQIKTAIVKDYKKNAAEDLTKQEYDELVKRLETAGKEPSHAQ